MFHKEATCSRYEIDGQHINWTLNNIYSLTDTLSEMQGESSI